MTGDSLAMDKLTMQKMMHDLKAPLTALKILRSRQKLLTSDDCLLKGLLQRLENLLSHATGEAMGTAPRALDGNRLATLCAGLISEKRLIFNTDFELAVECDDVALKVSPLDLYRILSNLLQNAGEACRDTGGAVRMTVTSRHGRIEFVVRDQGSGMDALALAALKRGSPLPRSRGWGVGLLIVRELIRNTGGQLEFASEPELGTKAKVSWPAHE